MPSRASGGARAARTGEAKDAGKVGGRGERTTGYARVGVSVWMGGLGVVVQSRAQLYGGPLHVAWVHCYRIVAAVAARA